MHFSKEDLRFKKIITTFYEGLVLGYVMSALCEKVSHLSRATVVYIYQNAMVYGDF